LISGMKNREVETVHCTHVRYHDAIVFAKPSQTARGSFLHGAQETSEAFRRLVAGCVRGANGHKCNLANLYTVLEQDRLIHSELYAL